MPICAVINESGYLVSSPVAQPAQCTGSLLLTVPEYQTIIQAQSLRITNWADAQSIALGVAVLLAIGFSFRQIARSINISSEEY